MSKNTKIIIAVVALLLPVIVVLVILNFREMEGRLAYHVEGEIRVIMGDASVPVSIDDMIDMGLVVFDSNHRRAEGLFTGVYLLDILRFSGLDYYSAVSVQFISFDGFRSSTTIAEATQEGNALIVFGEDGASLAERGGAWENAPFMLVLPNDMFPQRWARYIIEIVLE
ncbi:MAG: hypothetical protein FWE21_08005 [Defluviitaleaceae bacterium]|nr:hypothetical protein [Defluviitaleaceae bacterium]